MWQEKLEVVMAKLTWVSHSLWKNVKFPHLRLVPLGQKRKKQDGCYNGTSQRSCSAASPAQSPPRPPRVVCPLDSWSHEEGGSPSKLISLHVEPPSLGLFSKTGSIAEDDEAGRVDQGYLCDHKVSMLKMGLPNPSDPWESMQAKSQWQCQK